jgi:uroporphyrinogen-III synthase
MQPVKPTILCTGPVDESILDAAEYNDADIDIIPLTSISMDLSQEIQQKVKEILSQKALVIFTSNNAVRSVAAYMDKPPKDWTIYCIGNTTYALAKKYFGEEKIRQTAPTASKLAEKILPVINEDKVIFFCGNLRRNELPDALRQKGIEVKEITVYYTALAPVSIPKEYDAILFFSPSAAESYFKKNSLPAKTTLFVMGHTTAESIKKFSNNTIITGTEPDKSKLIKLAINYVLNNQAELNRLS